MWRANRGRTQGEKLRQAAQRKESGFTLIELLLAMSFLSVLLIAITPPRCRSLACIRRG